MNLSLPPPPTMATTHLHRTSPPAIQLQAPPPPRNTQQQNQTQIGAQHQPNGLPSPRPRQPHSQRADFTTVRPSDKSQDEWLRDSGHSSLNDFLEYYGFDQRDSEDVAQGRAFLQQIRRQEQEVWEERQARKGQQGAAPTSNVNQVASMHAPKPTGPFNGNLGSIARGLDEGYRIKATYAMDDPRERGFQQQNQMGMNMVMGNRGMAQRQIPRSSADPRYHVPVATIAGRAVSEAMMTAYGIKPWELEAAGGKMHPEFARYGH